MSLQLYSIFVWVKSSLALMHGVVKAAYWHGPDTAAGIYERESLLCCYFCQGLRATFRLWLLGFDLYELFDDLFIL